MAQRGEHVIQLDGVTIGYTRFESESVGWLAYDADHNPISSDGQVLTQAEARELVVDEYEMQQW